MLYLVTTYDISYDLVKNVVSFFFLATIWCIFFSYLLNALVSSYFALSRDLTLLGLIVSKGLKEDKKYFVKTQKEIDSC